MPVDMPDAPEAITTSTHSHWRLARAACSGVILLSVLGSVITAWQQSIGLTKVTVTAINPDAEPRDPGLPLLAQKHTLPDYQLTINLSSGTQIDAGAKLDTSAVDGISWTLNEPVPVAQIASITLSEQDAVISDKLAEVQLDDALAGTELYRFEFSTERSIAVGMQSFFRTPVGIAVVAAFFCAVFLVLFLNFGV